MPRTPKQETQPKLIVCDLDDRRTYRLTLKNSIVTVRPPNGNAVNVPVSLIAIETAGRRLHIWRVVCFLLLLFAVAPFGGMLIATGVCEIAQSAFGVAESSLSMSWIAGATGIPAALFFAIVAFRQLWKRNATVVIKLDNFSISFWKPRRKKRIAAMEQFFAAIESAKQNSATSVDFVTEETSMPQMDFQTVYAVFCGIVLCTLPSIMFENAWLLLFLLIPVFIFLRVWYLWITTPAPIRKAQKCANRGKWEEALGVLQADKTRSPEFNEDRLGMEIFYLVNLRRFAEAAQLLKAHIRLLRAEDYVALSEMIRTEREMFFAKELNWECGDWFLTPWRTE